MNVPSSPPPHDAQKLFAEAAEEVLKLYYARLELLCGAFLWKHKRLGLLVTEQANGVTCAYFPGARLMGKIPDEAQIALAECSYIIWKRLFPFEPEEAMVLFSIRGDCPDHTYSVEVHPQPANLAARITEVLDARDKHLRTLN